MFLVLGLMLVPSLSLNSVSLRVGSPTLLRRRRLALLLDLVAAELGIRSTRTRLPAVVGVLDAVDDGAGLAMMIMTLLLMKVMAMLAVRLCGLCRGSGRPHGYTCLIRMEELTTWQQQQQEQEQLARRGGERDRCRRLEVSRDASPSRSRCPPLTPRRRLWPTLPSGAQTLRSVRGPSRRMKFVGGIPRLGRTLASLRIAAKLKLAWLEFVGPPMGLGRRR